MTLGTDLGSIDANLGAINSVQSSWQLPPLPDQTKLDLASQAGLLPQHVGGFLTGIAGDINRAVNPLHPQPVTQSPAQASIIYDPLAAGGSSGAAAFASAFNAPSAAAQTAGAPQIQPVYPQQHSPSETDGLRSLFAGIAGEPAPSITDRQAVIKIKTQAKDMGLLPADFPVDGTWSPEMNGVYAQMNTQNFQRRSQGHKPGAFSIGSIIDKANEWLSPTFLIKTATKMKFLPSFSDINHELADWPAKWDKVSKTHSVHDLLDALTGPIDDIVVPLVNTAMLFSGVGEAYTFMRVGEMSAGAMEATSWASKAKALLIPGRYGLAEAAADKAAFAEPGWLAEKLGNTGAGDAMKAWRQLDGVQPAKKVMQVGMRLGQTGLAESTLMPDAGYSKGIIDLREHRSKNPQSYLLGDLFVDRFFTPTSIWPQGFLTAPIKAPIDYYKAKLSEVGKGARITDEVAKGTLSALRKTDPTTAAEFEQTMQTEGPSAALINYHGGGEGGAEKAGLHTLWNTVITGIDSEAVKMADLAQPDRTLDPANWRKVFYQGRTKKLAELKEWDPNQLDDYLDYTKATKGTKAYKQLIEKATDPAQRPALEAEYRAAVEDHNAKRLGIAGVILDQITPGMVQAHMARSFDHPNDWDNFTHSAGDLQAWVRQGAFPEAGTITKTIKQNNPEWDRALSLETRLRTYPDTLDKPLLEQELAAEKARLRGVPQTIQVQTETPNELRYAKVQSQNGRNLAVRPKGDPELDISKMIAPGFREEAPSVSWDGNFNPLVKGLDPGRNSWAIMRADTTTKQDAIRLLNETKGYFNRRDAALWLDQNRTHAGLLYTDLTKAAKEAGSDLGSLNPALATERARALYGEMTTKNVEAGAKLLPWMARNNVSIDDVVRSTSDQLEAAGRNPIWGENFGIASHLSTGEKYKKLKSLQNWMASEVEGAPKQLTDALEARGYKLAHGSGAFLMPGDLSGLVSPFEQVTKAQMRRQTLGTFLWGMHEEGADVNKAVGALRTQRFKDSLIERLTRAKAQGKLGTDLPLVLSHDSPDVDNILDLVRQTKQGMAERAAEGLDNAHGALNKFVERIHAAWAPSRVQDLARADVKGAIAPIYGDEVALHAYNALKDSFWLGGDGTMKYRGLAGVEDYLRSNSLPVSGLKLLSKTSTGARIFNAAAGAAVGYEAADKTGNDSRLGALAGAAAGALAGPGAAKRALNLVQDSHWDVYTRLPDPLFRLSQVIRFTLSPLFDVERAVKGTVLSQTADLPEGVSLPLSLRQNAFVKRYGEDAWNATKVKYAAAARGLEGADANLDFADETSRIFRQEGILGFSPVHQRVAAFGHLTQQGVEPDKAFNIAKKIFSYGDRSPLEQSINFLFFPFSFEKKLYSNVARFMSDDMGRAVAIHDSLRLYSALSDRYNLSEQLKEHLPLANELSKINAFAYGANLGEFGGIHRPWIDFFAPIALHGDVNPQKLAKRLIPAYRDIGHLTDDLQQQQHVVFGKNHLTTDAEAQKGWDALKQWKVLANQEAIRRGYTSYATSARDAGMADVAEKLKLYKAQLFNQYPAFKVQLADVVARQVANGMELQRRTLDPKTPEDRQLQAFTQQEEAVKAKASDLGFSFTNAPEDVPEDFYQVLRDTALSLGPSFIPTYNRYFRKLYGPVESQLH